MLSSTPYEIIHGGPKLTVRFTSNAADLKSAGSIFLVKFCRVFNLICEEAVEMLMMLIPILIVASLIIYLGAFVCVIVWALFSIARFVWRDFAKKK
jgi:hypothetical protein